MSVFGCGVTVYKMRERGSLQREGPIVLLLGDNSVEGETVLFAGCFLFIYSFGFFCLSFLW